jgi:hypothetical protein
MSKIYVFAWLGEQFIFGTISLYLQISLIGANSLFYALDAWLAWLLPLLASIAVLQRAGDWRTISR